MYFVPCKDMIMIYKIYQKDEVSIILFSNKLKNQHCILLLNLIVQ